MTNITKSLWESLAKRVKKVPGGLRLMEKMKEKYLDGDFLGEEVKSLGTGTAYQKVLEMMTADIEYQSLAESHRRAAERYKLKKREFWLTVLEETGLEEDSDLAFDPHSMKVYNRQKNDTRIEGSHQASLDGYKELVALALYNPLAASRMVYDPVLKFREIKALANAITEGDFKPKLRAMVQEWLQDPVKARKCQALLKEEELPQWLSEIAAKLGQRKKWNLN
jgi:hypothetical protein